MAPGQCNIVFVEYDDFCFLLLRWVNLLSVSFEYG